MAAGKLRVGVAVDTVTGFGRQIMRGVMKYASIKRRWLLLKEFMVFETDPTAWPRCDGIIAGIANPPVLKQFRKVARHVVCCSGSGDPTITPVVCMDDIAVGRLAATHLMDCQLRHFGYYGTLNNKLSDTRLRGFRETLGEHGFTCDQAPLTQAWNRPLRAGWQRHWPRLLSWIHRLPKPVGILAVDDMAADDLAAACFDAGIVIPDQVALIGVNNDDLLCEGAWPPITSVQPDYQRVGMMAAKLLDDLMGGKKLTPERRQVRLRPVGVVPRTSTDVLAVDEPELAAAVRYIREHACDPCSVGDVLRQVPVARRWLEKQFVQKLGRTPHDEITHVRMESAQRSLLDREMTIQQVAQHCGYSTVQSFNRVFRSEVGESPGAFRRARLQRQDA